MLSVLSRPVALVGVAAACTLALFYALFNLQVPLPPPLPPVFSEEVEGEISFRLRTDPPEDDDYASVGRLSVSAADEIDGRLFRALGVPHSAVQLHTRVYPFPSSELVAYALPPTSAEAAYAEYTEELARIETMGSYSCRNIAGSSKRSAHASADAIDVAAFVLADGRRISLIDDWTSGSTEEQRFLRVIQASACKRFGTVLGPGYNAAHRDHFHLERSGGGFCR